MSWLLDPNALAALLTLTALEIVLGIDNLIFIAITADRLPKHQQAKARSIGLALALIMRLALLASIAWIVSLKAEVFQVFGNPAKVRTDNGTEFKGEFDVLCTALKVKHVQSAPYTSHSNG